MLKYYATAVRKEISVSKTTSGGMQSPTKTLINVRAIKEEAEDLNLKTLRDLVARFHQKPRKLFSLEEIKELLASFEMTCETELLREWMVEYDEKGVGMDFKKLMNLLLDKLMLFEDTQDDLEKCFCIFDLDKTGYIEDEVMKDFLMNRGEAFSEEEYQQFSRKIVYNKDKMINVSKSIVALVEK